MRLLSKALLHPHCGLKELRWVLGSGGCILMVAEGQADGQEETVRAAAPGCCCTPIHPTARGCLSAHCWLILAGNGWSRPGLVGQAGWQLGTTVRQPTPHLMLSPASDTASACVHQAPLAKCHRPRDGDALSAGGWVLEAPGGRKSSSRCPGLVPSQGLQGGRLQAAPWLPVPPPPCPQSSLWACVRLDFLFQRGHQLEPVGVHPQCLHKDCLQVQSHLGLGFQHGPLRGQSAALSSALGVPRDQEVYQAGVLGPPCPPSA